MFIYICDVCYFLFQSIYLSFHCGIFYNIYNIPSRIWPVYGWNGLCG